MSDDLFTALRALNDAAHAARRACPKDHPARQTILSVMRVSDDLVDDAAPTQPEDEL